MNYNFSDKQVILMRGISGAGKTKTLDDIKEEYPGAVTVSADFYFMRDKDTFEKSIWEFDESDVDDKRYNFDPRKLSDAHRSCQVQFIKHLKSNASPIIVDNTNLSLWEMKPYMKLAEKFGYDWRIIQINTPTDIIKERQSGRNEELIEGDKALPPVVVDNMKRRMRERLPPDVADKVDHMKGF